MVTEIPRSPSICAQRKNNITEKRKIVKSNLQTQALKITRLARQKFPQGKVGDTVKVRVPDVDRGRCDSRNILGVIMEADLTKDLHRHARNQFSTSTEGTVNILDVPSVNISLRECAGKASLFGGQGYRRCNCKTLRRSNLCSCRRSNKLCNSSYVTIVYHAKINDICFDTIMFYIVFVLFSFFLLLLADVMKNSFCLFPCIIFWSTCKQLFVTPFILHLLLHSLTELGDFIHSLRESSHYTYLLVVLVIKFGFSSDFPTGLEIIHNSREICIITNFITFTVTYILKRRYNIYTSLTDIFFGIFSGIFFS